jgi:hypothetical protein
MNAQVRIVIDRDGARYYLGTFVDDPRARGNVLPQLLPASSVRQSWLGSRDRAVSLVKELRQHSWDAHILDPGTGSLLYEEAVQRYGAPTPASEERVPMQRAGILIVPGNPRGYFIRFPGQSIDSIFGNTADECYQKLISHPQAKTLLPLAEKYVEPTETHTEPAIPRARLRPGSL